MLLRLLVWSLREEKQMALGQMALWQEKALHQQEQQGGSTDKGGQQGGKQSGAKETPQETLERLSARNQLHTRALFGNIFSKIKNRLALQRAKKIAYIWGSSREGGTGADEEIMLSEIDVS
eukprot:1148128-Pelagomonas_calceolata.AAC.1